MNKCAPMQREFGKNGSLLGSKDASPVVTHGEPAPFLLTVEHAGRAIPESLADLGLPAGQIDRHIGWDIGAYDLARAMVQMMPAFVLAQRYSRIVIDSNRPWDAEDLIPAVTDRTIVPANTSLDEEARKQRWDEIHQPFHDAVSDYCAGKEVRALIAVHSYEPKRDSDDGVRPWPIGLLWRRANPLAEGLAVRLAREAEMLPVGINEPYEIEDASDFTIPMHAERRELPHVLVEVRNDYLRDEVGIGRMAGILTRACLDLELL